MKFTRIASLTLVFALAMVLAAPTSWAKENGHGHGSESEHGNGFAFGHLIAPGWLKNHIAPAIESFSWLPHGIAKKLGLDDGDRGHDNDNDGDDGNQGHDVTAPTISNVVANATYATATISWNTNENARSMVYVSTSSPVDPNAAGTRTWTNNNYRVSHEAVVSGLDASTHYYAYIKATDGSGNVSTSSTFSFTTNATPNTTAPVISNIVVDPGANVADVSWTTNENADSMVYVSTSTPIDLHASTTMTFGTTTASTSHMIHVTGLDASTTYYVIVASTDGSSNTATSGPFSFTTDAVDTIAPVISNTIMVVGTSTMHVTWATDEPATTMLYASTTTGFGIADTGTLTASDSTLVTNHDITLSGLTTATTYYIRIASEDAANNTAVTNETNVTTSS